MNGERRRPRFISKVSVTESPQLRIHPADKPLDLSAIDAEVEAVMIAAMNDRGWLMRRTRLQQRYLRSLRRGFRRRDACIAKALDCLDDADG